MKKIAILLLLMTLSDASIAQSQWIANVIATNDRGLLPTTVEGTFKPDRPSSVCQDTISHARGTLSLPDTDNYSVCNYISEEAYADLMYNNLFQDSYDTFKLYITSCY